MGNFKSKIILLLSIVVISIFITACGSENDSNGVSKAVEGEKVEEIFVKTDGGNIIVRSTSDEEVKLNVKGNKEVNTVIEGEKLIIDISESSSIINFKTETLYVDVPNKIYKEISLITTSGEISGEDLQAEKLTFSTDSGDVDIKGVNGDKIDGNASSGNISIDTVKGELDINNKTGNIYISHQGHFEGDSKINSTSGKIEMVFGSKPNDLKLDVATASGNIKSSLFSESDIREAGNKLNVELGSANATLTIRSSSGNIHVD